MFENCTSQYLVTYFIKKTIFERDTFFSKSVQLTVFGSKRADAYALENNSSKTKNDV